MREYPKMGCACGKARCTCSKGKMRSSRAQAFAVGGMAGPDVTTMQAPAQPMGTSKVGSNKPIPTTNVKSAVPAPQTTAAAPAPQTTAAAPASQRPSGLIGRIQHKAAKRGFETPGYTLQTGANSGLAGRQEAYNSWAQEQYAREQNQSGMQRLLGFKKGGKATRRT